MEPGRRAGVNQPAALQPERERTGTHPQRTGQASEIPLALDQRISRPADSRPRARDPLDGQPRPLVEKLVVGAGLGAGLGDARDRLVDVLLSIAGARTASSTLVDPMWTMPGHLAQSSPLTSSVPTLIRAATTSVVCSTCNFTAKSELWQALGEVAQRPAVSVRLYIDTEAAKRKGGRQPPIAAQIAQQLKPGRVLRTVKYQGHPVRNHAKLVIVDHRFVLVTSANFSYSAAYSNIEFGIKLDNPGLAESVERELRDVEGVLYERVIPSGGTA